VISPSFLVGRCDHGVFVRRLVGVVGVLLCGGIFFLHVMVGGDGGVVRPKKLVGWVGTVTTVSKYQKFEMGLRRSSPTSSLQI
jgi:hypothetical protein